MRTTGTATEQQEPRQTKDADGTNGKPHGGNGLAASRTIHDK